MGLSDFLKLMAMRCSPKYAIQQYSETVRPTATFACLESQIMGYRRSSPNFRV